MFKRLVPIIFLFACVLVVGLNAQTSTASRETNRLQHEIHTSTKSPALMGFNATYGGSGAEEANSVIQTSDGGYLLAGYTSSFGAGQDDAWLVKGDADGNPQWNKTYGGVGRDHATSVLQTGDGGYAFAGYTNSYTYPSYDNDAWLVKTNSSGDVEWAKTYGGTSQDVIWSFTKSQDGGYALAGSTSSFGVSGIKFWLFKTDSNGNAAWNTTYGTASVDVAYSIIQTSDDGYMLAGSTDVNNTDFYVVKTDSGGNLQWNETYGGDGYDVAHSVVQTTDGGYAIAGWTDSIGQDGWLIKILSNGVEQWNQTYGGSGADVLNSVIQTTDGGYALGGQLNPSGILQVAWLVKTDLSGNVQWNETYGGNVNSWVDSLIQTSDGGYALTGYMYGSSGTADFLLIKTDNYGIIPEISAFWILPILMIASSMLVLYLRKSNRYHISHPV